MQYVRWSPGTTIADPVYLDANILVGTVIRGHRLYKLSAQLFGELLARQSAIVLSDLALSESLWAISRLAYGDLFNQPPSARWSKEIYRRHVARIFQQRGNWMSALPDSIKALASAGHPINVVQASQAEWLSGMKESVQFMSALHLTPGDAIHLALASTHARTMVTGDSDFSIVTTAAQSNRLTVLQIRP
jgi:predicted nucleic acid-binding protein